MRRARVRSKRKRGSALYIGILFLLLLAGAAFLYTLPQFEKTPPQIVADSNIVVGADGSIDFQISDNYALKRVELLIKNGDKKRVLLDKPLAEGLKVSAIHLKLPKEIVATKNGEWSYEIVVTDRSLWNFFLGNRSHKNGVLYIDSVAPQIRVIARSPAILKGGSALVIYKVDEEHLKESYIDIGQGRVFKAIPYKKEGVYVSLIAWPFNQEQFTPKIIAVDSAGNRASLPLSIRRNLKRYRVSYIAARDSFIDGKIAELASEYPQYANIKDRLERLRAINEELRLINEKLIHQYTKAVTPIGQKWEVHRLYPLHRAKRVSDFGVKRYYYYKRRENIVSTSYHLGYDLASIKHDKIYSSMPGVVVYAAPNGIYGNMIIIDHGLGLFTLYGHTSQMRFKANESVTADEVIGLTGKSGLALGDHLHFGVLVQGIEVYPLEWMNKKWINDYILSVFQKADIKLGYN